MTKTNHPTRYKSATGIAGAEGIVHIFIEFLRYEDENSLK
jgi:hypothetical protein